MNIMNLRHIMVMALSAALAAGISVETKAQEIPGISKSEVDDEDDAEEEDITEEDNDDADVRENAVIDFGEINGDDIDIPVPSFIRQNHNHIIFNGADWSPLRQAFASATSDFDMPGIS